MTLVKKIKKIFGFAVYKDAADFFNNASEKEQLKLYKKAAVGAMKDRQALLKKAKKIRQNQI